jgi:hypothetical protein
MAKGTLLADIPKIALVFVAFGVILGIGMYISGQVEQQGLSTTTVTNESVNFVSNASETVLAYPFIQSVTAIYNNTYNNVTIASGNYTVSETGITCCDGVKVPQGVRYVTYVAYSSQSNPSIYALHNTTSGLSTLSGYLPIIGVIIAAAVIIGVLVHGFIKKDETL